MLKSLDEKIKIIGATASKQRSGNRIGAGDFPLPFLAMFEIGYRSIKIVYQEIFCWVRIHAGSGKRK